MKFVKTLIAVAATTCALNANAAFVGLTFAQAAATGPDVGQLVFTSTTGTVFANTFGFGTPAGSQAVPGGLLVTDPYSVVKIDSSATISFGTAGVKSFTFLWGSPDTYNYLDIMTTGTSALTQTYGGTDLGVLGGFSASGSNLNSRVFSMFADSGVSISSITFRSTGNAFEIDKATSPIPEPETYALMLAGLGAVGFMARRRRSSQASM